jgi:CMP-N,N'-diacetyllegionaminic acid synthase
LRQSDGNVTVVIPARGGSKGVPGKNLMPVGGTPLLVWSIDSAKHVAPRERILVSPDHADIAALARRNGATVIERPHDLAGDRAPTEPVIEHALDAVGAGDDGVVMLLQPPAR